jgi:hypothetical protein
MPYQVLLGFRERERLRGATGQEQRLSGKTSLRRLETEPRCARKTVTGLDGVRWHALLSSRMLLNGIAAALPSAINKASLGGRRSSQGQPIGTPNLGPFCPAAPQAKQFCQNVQYEIISSEITVAARHNFPVPRGNCARTGRVALWTLSLPRISVLFLGDLGQSRYRTRAFSSKTGEHPSPLAERHANG